MIPDSFTYLPAYLHSVYVSFLFMGYCYMVNYGWIWMDGSLMDTELLFISCIFTCTYYLVRWHAVSAFLPHYNLRRTEHIPVAAQHKYFCHPCPSRINRSCCCNARTSIVSPTEYSVSILHTPQEQTLSTVYFGELYAFVLVHQIWETRTQELGGVY